MSDPITATLLISAVVLSAGAQVFGAVSEKRAADDQAELIDQQAQIEQQETAAEAERKGEERRKFIAQQKVAFLANGIGLAGTPLVVLEDTFQQFEKEISSIKRSGRAKAGLLTKQADITRKTGKAKLISGVLGAGTTIAAGAFQGKQAKVF
jgi:hypothetical protein